MRLNLTVGCSLDSYIRYLRFITQADSSFYHYYVAESKTEKAFYGEIDSQKFRVIPRIQGRNHFTPILTGRCRGSSPVQINLHISNAPFAAIWMLLATVFLLRFLVALLVHQPLSTPQIISYLLLLVACVWFLLWNHLKKVEITKKYLLYLGNVDNEALQGTSDNDWPQEAVDRTPLASLIALTACALKILCTILCIKTHANILTQLFLSSSFFTSLLALIYIKDSAGEAFFLLGLLLAAVIIEWIAMTAGFFLFSIQKTTSSDRWFSRFFRLFFVVMILEAVCCIVLFVIALYTEASPSFMLIMNAVLSLVTATFTFHRPSNHRPDN